ncbi:CpsB/CapC family capsule biosynthesis tyrosine phosphatase [Gracilibacillus sp. YIM 98692]|uniref:tyrosine-protein phosphatase n=1 Tax=Gracilibacillus sp. YIM 98692 TaxID=2663532 RepID=UPI0013D516B5|nr:CpsB/CapC family capsule biosynthesis tyrosine phosphatase [Gracilibacillus sp. YIM 98692]
MIDVRCHILPDQDRGVRHLEDSVQLVRQMTKQGVKQVVVAPSHTTNTADDIITKTQQLEERLKQEAIDLDIIVGQTIRIEGDWMQVIEEKSFLFLNKTTSYAYIGLVEHSIPPNMKKLIYDLQLKGIKPIITHPERHQPIVEDPNLLYEWVKNGALVEIDGRSLIGKHGKKIQKCTTQLIEHHLVHFIGSEASNPKEYKFQQMMEKLRKQFDRNMEQAMQSNSQAMLLDQPVVGEEPIRIRKRKILGLL